MEKITKKISYIEKTINKMKKEINTIKNTYNSNATNSFINNSNYINRSTKISKNKQLKNQKLNFKKNYFQLSEKEKKYYEDKKRMQNPHSFNIKKKKLNIYNHIIDYSIDTYNNDLNNENEKNSEIPKNERIQNNNNDKRFSRMAILQKEMNDNKDLNDIENNFGFESHNIYFNYNLNGQNKRGNGVLSNFTKKNMSENRKNNYKNLSVEEHLNKSNKILAKKIKSKLYHFKKDDIKQDKNNNIIRDINNIINNDNDINYMKNNEDIFSLKDSNTYNEVNKSNINDKRELDYNSIINNNLENDYYILNGNNTNLNDNNNFYLYNNYNEKENHKNYESQNIEDQYSEIMNILGDSSKTKEIINKSILFDKYGTKGFVQYLNNQKIINNSSIINSSNMHKYLFKYKNYIESFQAKNESKYLKQINSYKNLCSKLLSEANSNKIQKLAEKINYKLEKTQHNKRVLENIKNILVKITL